MSVEFSSRLLLFYITIGSVQAVLDVIVLLAWRAFVRSRMRSHGWSAWWYRAPIIAGVIMFCVFPYTVYLRQNEIHPSLFNKILHRALSVWYMPKIAVVAGLLGYWVMRWIDKRFSRVVIDGLDAAEKRMMRGAKALQAAWQQAIENNGGSFSLWQRCLHVPKNVLRTFSILFCYRKKCRKRLQIIVCTLRKRYLLQQYSHQVQPHAELFWKKA